MSDNHTLKIDEILELLPHRYPFLLVDRVLDFEEGKFLRAVKNVSFNEPFFQGHFQANRFFRAFLFWKRWLRPPAFWRSKAWVN